MTSAYYQPSAVFRSLPYRWRSHASSPRCRGRWAYAWLALRVAVDITCLVSDRICVLAGAYDDAVAAQAKVRHPRWIGRLGIALGLAAWFVQWAAIAAHDATSDPHQQSLAGTFVDWHCSHTPC